MRRILLLLLIIGLTSCAHNEVKQGSTSDGDTKVDKQELVKTGEKVTAEDVQLPPDKAFHEGEQGQNALVDPELENIPEDMEEAVEKWIDYFQGRGRSYMERYLTRSTRYMGIMKKILKDNELPEDLVYVALIESGFSGHVTSRAGAGGYWQFIRGTGRRFGLEINQLVDDRRDPVHSTQAAAKYLKELYEDLGSWHLAMASYNVGEGRIKREMNRHLTNDFWVLAKKKRIPKETREYVPKYFAAKLIAKNPAEYGFGDIEYQPPMEFDVINVDKHVNLRQFAQNLGVTYEELKSLNPKYRGEVAPVKNGTNALRIPVGKSDEAQVAVTKCYVDKVIFVADKGETLMYKIRPGDTLSTIARRYRVSMAEIKDLNQIGRKSLLRSGTRIFIPDRGVDASIASMKAKFKLDGKRKHLKKASVSENRSVASQDIRRLIKQEAGREKTRKLMTAMGDVHVVRSGENLTTISKKYGVSINAILKANSLKRRSILRAGLRLRIPDDNES